MRKKRETHRTPLALFLEKLLKEKQLAIREAALIAGCSPSVLHGWLQGSYPAETMPRLKALCNHFGYSLALALVGEPDGCVSPHDVFISKSVVEGYARIRIEWLEERRS